MSLYLFKQLYKFSAKSIQRFQRSCIHKKRDGRMDGHRLLLHVSPFVMLLRGTIDALPLKLYIQYHPFGHHSHKLWFQTNLPNCLSLSLTSHTVNKSCRGDDCKKLNTAEWCQIMQNYNNDLPHPSPSLHVTKIKIQIQM